MPTTRPETEFLQQPGQRDNTAATHGVILLAAGFSRRFGSSKLTALLPNGKTVFAQTYARIKAATPNILVVTRPDLLDSLLDAGAPSTDTVLCDDAALGMGHTVACGIRHLPPHWSAVLICLADMPFIETDTYTQLFTALTSDCVLVPEHQNQRGNPVGFGAKWFPALAAATGDSGGREIMKSHPEAITRIAVNDPHIHSDVDVPEDLDIDAKTQPPKQSVDRV